MSLLALGINHNTAPLEVRERLVFAPETLPEALVDLKRLQGVSEAAIVSTCNRTEIYCESAPPHHVRVADWLREYHAISAADFEPYLFSLADRDAVRHLLRVSSGLDSLILGEPQILGQIKSAYQTARAHGAVGTQLHRLFQHAFTVAKKVRTDTSIGASPVSVAYAAVSLARQIFGDLQQATALLIGAGDTIELASRHLATQGAGQLIIANRTLQRARTLAQTCGAQAVTLADIPTVLASADIVISSTASTLPILGKGAVERALRQRKHRPMFMVDVAVPRDVEPEVARLDDVFLYTVDDLQTVIEENLATRREAAELAEDIVNGQVEHFMDWLRSLSSLDTIKAYREQGERNRVEIVARARTMSEQGKTVDEVVDYVAHTLQNKLMHNATQRMRRAAEEGDQALLQAARELLGLKDEEP